MSQNQTLKREIKGQAKLEVRDTEVVPKAKRRQFSRKYKARILKEADGCNEPGQIGALLRREGIYSSYLTAWRRQQEGGELEPAQQPKRGRKPKSEAEQELVELRQENKRLRARLAQAEAVIDVQKKVSHLFGLTLNKPQEDETA
jgi:transposase-like protein